MLTVRLKSDLEKVASTRQYRTRNLIEGQSGNRNGNVLLSYSLDMPLLPHVRSVLRVRGPLDLATSPPILPPYLPTLSLLLPSARRRVCTSPFSIIVIRRSVRVLVVIAPVRVRIMVRVAALTSRTVVTVAVMVALRSRT